MPSFPDRVVVREVGLRDGLQSIRTVLPTERKKAWIRARTPPASARSRSARSFRRKLLPQLADTAELVAYAKTLPGLVVSVLVPNLKGAERALDSGADVMLVPLSASHAHSLANLRKTPDEVVAEVGRIRAARDAAGVEDADRGRHRHRLRLHDPGRGEDERGAALPAGAARRRRRPRQHRRHRRLRRPGRGARPVRAGARDRRRALLLRPLPRHARPRAGQRLRRARDRRRPLRRQPGRHRRLPARARRERQRRHRGPRLHAREHGHRDRHRHRAAARAARRRRRLARGRDAARRALARRAAEGACRSASRRRARGRDAHERRAPHRPAARRHPRRRVHAHGDGADLRDDPRRPRRRGDQGRAAGRRQDAQAARARHRLLPLVQPQQEERRPRHPSAGRPAPPRRSWSARATSSSRTSAPA